MVLRDCLGDLPGAFDGVLEHGQLVPERLLLGESWPEGFGGGAEFFVLIVFEVNIGGSDVVLQLLDA
jgi:hypothetical protein